MNEDFESKLREYVQSELESSLELIKSNKLVIEIPSGTDVDLGIEELASLVASSSNKFAAASRLAGLAKAESKLAKGAYDRAFKKSGSAIHLKNDKQRTAYAMEQSEKEHGEYILAEAISAIAESIEAGARVSSESLRKLFDKSYNMMVGHNRAEHAASTIDIKNTSPW